MLDARRWKSRTKDDEDFSDEAGLDEETKQTPNSVAWKRDSRRRRRWWFFGLALVLVGLVALHHPSREYVVSLKDTVLPAEKRHIHLVIPASMPHQRLCKTILSGMALGYPMPLLVNWGMSFTDTNLVHNGTHLAKIAGGLRQLKFLVEDHPDDLFIMIDGYDTWFQLGPEVFLKRYNRINKEANDRIRAEFGPATSFKQSVVFSAQKKCWPTPWEAPACQAVAKSTLPDDLFGDLTDRAAGGNDLNPFQAYRPRWLNSGFIMGPVADLLPIFERAQEKLEVGGPNFGSDQWIFSEIYGGQEWARNSQRDGSPGPTDGVNHEFGIGLDFGMELSQVTVFTEDEIGWIRRNDMNRIQDLSEKVQVPSQYRIHSTSVGDLETATRPFADLTPDDSASLPDPSTTWNQVPLLTDVFTGNSPASVHLNAHRVGKIELDLQWNMTWFQPELRTILRHKSKLPPHPIARLPDASGKMVEWWPLIRSVRVTEVSGAWSDAEGAFLEFSELCPSEDWEIIMQDGGGPWIPPVAR